MVWSTLLVLVLCVLTVCLCSGAKESPNIVFILADDLGWNDVGYHGSEIETPNIDYLATNGIRLENYYVQQVCSPSRAALMTGRYPIHTGLQHEVLYSGQRSGVPLELKTLANELKERGYDTHGVGKWHLGFFEKNYLPTERGFDSWTGYLTGNEGYYDHVNCMPIGCGYDFYENTTLDTSDNTTYSTIRYTERAKEIILGHASSGSGSRPLFLYLPYQAVHFPLQAPDSYIKKYDFITNHNRRIFAGMASCMDESIGNITSYLKASNMWNNTILIFSTDNGGETHSGGNNWPLRGKKWTLWEGGVRGVSFVYSPLLATNKGTIHNSLMHISDWYPTILSGILGESLAPNPPLDGVNMWESILSRTQGPRTEILHTIDPLDNHPGDALYNDTFLTNTTAAIRVGDWKLLTGNPGDNKTYPPDNDNHEEIAQEKSLNDDQSYSDKYILEVLNRLREKYRTFWPRYEEGASVSDDIKKPQVKNVWLFNITADPEENYDVSGDYPEVVKQLLERLSFYNSTAVKPNFPPIDPLASPTINGGAWRPWVNTDTSGTQSILQTLVKHMKYITSKARNVFGN